MTPITVDRYGVRTYDVHSMRASGRDAMQALAGKKGADDLPSFHDAPTDWRGAPSWRAAQAGWHGSRAVRWRGRLELEAPGVPGPWKPHFDPSAGASTTGSVASATSNGQLRCSGSSFHRLTQPLHASNCFPAKLSHSFYCWPSISPSRPLPFLPHIPSPDTRKVRLHPSPTCPNAITRAARRAWRAWLP